MSLIRGHNVYQLFIGYLTSEFTLYLSAQIDETISNEIIFDVA